MKKLKWPLTAVFATVLVSCNNSSDNKEKKDDTSSTSSTSTTAPAPFSKEVTYGNYKFVVSTAGEGDDHHFKIIPSGLTEKNDTLHEDVKGAIKDVIINDIDGDNSPEIGVVDVSGADNEGHLHVFSTYDGKSMGAVQFAELPASDKSLQGYKGGDEYEFVENTLVRRFPLYEGDTKTGKTRQMQYKLKKGENSKVLELDKTTDF